MTAADPLGESNAPKMDEDFSSYFMINNLPKCKAEKIPKLVALIESTLKKKKLNVEPEDIEIEIDPSTNETFGVAYINMKNEENARFAASIFDGFKLTKNNIFATCLMPEFEKIMQTSEEFTLPEAAADLEDLRAPIFDITHDQYLYKSGKNVHVNQLGSSAQVNKTDSVLKTFENLSNEPTQWSPKGTYLISIKTEKIEFLGGKDMIPIITLPQSKVKAVNMSPCESYVMTYSPESESAYTVWNFQLVEIIREFEAAYDEDQDSYQWNFDGSYIAKKFVTEIEKDGETKTKTGVSVYELPSMQLLETSDG